MCLNIPTVNTTVMRYIQFQIHLLNIIKIGSTLNDRNNHSWYLSTIHFFGSLSLFLTLTEIDLKRLVIVRSAYEAIFHNLFLIFIILDFFLEYFIIKIRAGFAIGMISLAVYFFLLGGRVPRMISVALFGASFFYSPIYHNSSCCVHVTAICLAQRANISPQK